ncbi:MFS transporter [Planomonospora sp. ID82291]|uniref:MFS transporter n=1 Tax=Planomonospora sp. ID82291 TaxID=2738136 RepID=UPI0018C3EFE1|nr:MFS transporter [Planomonospora sp. ID82291]MBG0816363.1 MFS transporter [Planomonospora sp. ID82291]
MRGFTTLWAGYLVSVLGSSLTSLALGVWVFQQTGSATQYGLVIVMSFLPGILVTPPAGALVDRWSRRSTLAASNALSAVTIFALAGLFLSGTLQPWHIFIVVGVQSLLRAFTVPAMNSVVILLVPKEQVGRANGMVLLAQALGGTLGFAAGGVLLMAVGLGGVLLLDCASFVVSMLAVLLVPVPHQRRTAADPAGGGGLGGEIRQGWRYLLARRGLLALVVLYGAVGVAVAPADVLITPVVLSFASPEVLGLVLGGAGLGAVAGSLVLAVWGGPRRRIHALAGLTLPIGAFICLGVARPSVTLIMVAAFGYSLFSTIVDGTARGVLQVEVEPEVQGRVFAFFNMVANTVQCAAFALAGPLADQVFEPLLRDGGALTGSVGTFLGVGPGRGTALLLLICGLAVIVTALVAYRQPDLRALPDRPSGGAKENEPESSVMALAQERADGKIS